MNAFAAFTIDFVITLLFGALLMAYIRTSLYGVLVDLCGGETRARFWLSFSVILLIGVPVASALGYVPAGDGFGPGSPFFDITMQLGRNLMSFLFALLGLGLVVGFFALVAPRTNKAQPS